MPESSDNQEPERFYPKVLEISLGNALKDSFDYEAFRSAIHADPAFSPEQKADIARHFDPDNTFFINLQYPGESLHLYAEKGLRHKILEPGQNYFPNKQESLPAEHPVTQAWADVWQQSLSHYAREAERYERKFGTDASAYPRAVPPIHQLKGDMSVNAGVYYSRRNRCVEVEVTEGFMTALSPETQAAILAHEAGHLMEPIQLGIKPETYFSGIKGAIDQISMNATRRYREYRADGHVIALGRQRHYNDFFPASDASKERAHSHRERVSQHLRTHGFAFDVEQAASLAGSEYVAHQMRRDPQADFLTVMNQGRSMEHQASGELSGFNRRLHDTAPPRSPNAMNKIIGKLRATMEDMTATHPPDAARMQRMQTAGPFSAMQAVKNLPRDNNHGKTR